MTALRCLDNACMGGGDDVRWHTAAADDVFDLEHCHSIAGVRRRYSYDVPCCRLLILMHDM